MFSTQVKAETRTEQKVRKPSAVAYPCCSNCQHFYFVESNKIASTYRCDIDQSIIIHPKISGISCMKFSPKDE